MEWVTGLAEEEYGKECIIRHHAPNMSVSATPPPSLATAGIRDVPCELQPIQHLPTILDLSEYVKGKKQWKSLFKAATCTLVQDAGTYLDILKCT